MNNIIDFHEERRKSLFNRKEKIINHPNFNKKTQYSLLMVDASIQMLYKDFTEASRILEMIETDMKFKKQKLFKL